MLAALKATIGIITASISVTLDAVNNLSDASSSVITIVGTKLSTKNPTKKHPFGYGRIEYFTTIIIAMIVVYAGASACVEAIKEIIHPEEPSYTVLFVVLLD